MYLKHYLRGLALTFSALICSSIIVAAAVQEALAIVDKINTGELSIATGGIPELVTSSTGGAHSTVSNIATLLVVATWLIGIVDSYRLGISREK